MESGQTPPKSSGFSFKGLSSMIFGAESPEVLGTKISNLEEQINDAEEVVKTTKEDLRYDTVYYFANIIGDELLLNFGAKFQR